MGKRKVLDLFLSGMSANHQIRKSSEELCFSGLKIVFSPAGFSIPQKDFQNMNCYPVLDD